MQGNNNDYNVFVLSVMLTVVSVVGIIGNLIVATVYWQKKDKQTSTFFILVLSCSDLCVCSVLIPLTIYMEQQKYITSSMLVCRLFYFLTTSIVPASCLIMTAIAFDRYFCICMVRHNIMTQQRARLLVVVILLCSGLMGVVPSWNSTLDTVSYQDNCLQNQTHAAAAAAAVAFVPRRRRCAIHRRAAAAARGSRAYDIAIVTDTAAAATVRPHRLCSYHRRARWRPPRVSARSLNKQQRKLPPVHAHQL